MTYMKLTVMTAELPAAVTDLRRSMADGGGGGGEESTVSENCKEASW
jgi:hypothetical protein